MDQLPLERFENSRVELLFCQNSLIVSFVKSWFLVGRSSNYGKKGEIDREMCLWAISKYFGD